MTETIKDVMETLIEYANGGVSGLYPPEDDIQELVDYILDLQEEIERLEKENERYRIAINEMAINISKAIEHIKMYDGKPVLRDYYDRDLLNILQGSDKE